MKLKKLLMAKITHWNSKRLYPLETEEQKIFIYLVDNEKISRKEAVVLLNLKNTKTYEILNLLVEKRMVEKAGKGRSTYYKLFTNA